jgi:prevent-host-death family protein
VEDAEKIGIRELRQHASRYVAMAKAGKRVAVTDRGKLVASLVPADKSVFEQLVAAGQVERATGKGFSDLLPVPPGPPGEGSLSDALQEMRDEERY